MDGVQLPQGYSHFEEAVYFLPFSSQWLQNNGMKGNTGKNHFLVSSNFRDTIKIDSN